MFPASQQAITPANGCGSIVLSRQVTVVDSKAMEGPVERSRENCLEWEGLVVVGQQQFGGEGCPSVIKRGFEPYGGGPGEGGEVRWALLVLGCACI